MKYHLSVAKKELSLTNKISLHDILIIQGDNLKALKALLPTSTGKVKCVCIGPPYNTGEEGWVYGNNVNSRMIQEWFKSEVPVDKEDNKYNNYFFVYCLSKIIAFIKRTKKL